MASESSSSGGQGTFGKVCRPLSKAFPMKGLASEACCPFESKAFPMKGLVSEACCPLESKVFQ